MRNREKKPVRRVDVREPLEKLSLLELKKPDPNEPLAGRDKTAPKSAHHRRWM